MAVAISPFFFYSPLNVLPLLSLSLSPPLPPPCLPRLSRGAFAQKKTEEEEKEEGAPEKKHLRRGRVNSLLQKVAVEKEKEIAAKGKRKDPNEVRCSTCRRSIENLRAEGPLLLCTSCHLHRKIFGLNWPDRRPPKAEIEELVPSPQPAEAALDETTAEVSRSSRKPQPSRGRPEKVPAVRNFAARTLVFVDPLDDSVPFWWPAMVSPPSLVNRLFLCFFPYFLRFFRSFFFFFS